MKKILFLVVFLAFSNQTFAQSNTEIAGIYLIKAEEKLNIDMLDQALGYFDKAQKLLGAETTAKVEELGTMIYYKLKDFEKSKTHAKKYFELEKDKTSESYSQVLYLYVDLEEQIELQKEQDRKEREIAMFALKKQQRLDSLKNVWQEKADALIVSADTIYKLDKNGVAVFKSPTGNYGVITVDGKELIAPGAYANFSHFDGYIVLMEGVKGQPTSIKVLNTTSLKEITIPPVAQFNSLSTHYGQVMLPRDNHYLVCYPNNATKVAVYNLETNSLLPTPFLERHFKYWKDKKVIKKFNDDNQIKIEKDYLNFGGDLKGFSVFYTETGSIYAYISSGGNILLASQYTNIGTFSNGFSEAIKGDGQQVWINEKGIETKPLLNKNGDYVGTAILEKVGPSKYHFINEAGQITKDEETLESLEKFLKKQQ
ncbi:hypothetical protein [Flavicella sediminum]|uniref:hypothetical protein n=1 Tax=Flavicella sediminum TaxID=2585141 RepID=UPI00111C9D20|nr:hypothetical protein [Flavicella sediminum]